MTNVDLATAILTDALKRCRREDMRTNEVLRHSIIAIRSPQKNGRSTKLRFALNTGDGERRWQQLNLSLNGINRLFAPKDHSYVHRFGREIHHS